MMIPENLVQYDFRRNLIADPDNPVLIQKAWRDHFAGKSYWQPGKDGGKAYLGVANSEDAMTWNVFRSLQLEGRTGLRVVADAFGFSAVETVLFWGCDVEVEKQSDIQQLLNILIRTIDGQLKGTMTEPDLVFVTEDEVAFIECKLNLNGNKSPWKAQRGPMDEGNGAAHRMKSYVGAGFEEMEGLKNWEEVYQLIRQYVYATRMAAILQKQPVVVPLINAEHAGLLKTVYSIVQDYPLNKGGVFRNLVTWQDISARVASSGLPCSARVVTKMAEALESSRKKRRTTPST